MGLLKRIHGSMYGGGIMRLSEILKYKFGDETQHLCPNCFETTRLRTNAIGAWKAYLIGKSPVKPSKYHHYCSKCYTTQLNHSPAL